MWASMVFYWEYFWACLWEAIKVYFGSLINWLNIATFLGGNIYGAMTMAKNVRKYRGWEDPNLIYSPKLDDYVQLERFNRIEGEWRHSYEDIPEEERTWFHRAMIWLGLDPSK